MAQSGGRDGMVSEIDEAGCLKSVQDGFGRCFALGWSTFEERGKVDKLQRLPSVRFDKFDVDDHRERFKRLTGMTSPSLLTAVSILTRSRGALRS